MRLIPLAIAALSFLYFGYASLDFQTTRTQTKINMTANTGQAYNVSEGVYSQLGTTLGVSTPGFMLAALVAFLAVILWVVLQ